MTPNERWLSFNYDEKCKDRTYKTTDPALVKQTTRKNIFLFLFVKHSGKCNWCNVIVSLTRNTSNEGTIDHLKTKNMGRRNYYDGGHVLACRKCNEDRNVKERTELKQFFGLIRLRF